MVFYKDQYLILHSSYSASTMLTKLLYMAMYTTFQMMQICSTVRNLLKQKNKKANKKKRVNHYLKHLKLKASKTKIVKPDSAQV